MVRRLNWHLRKVRRRVPYQEERHREAVVLVVAGLRQHPVDELQLRVSAQPLGLVGFTTTLSGGQPLHPIFLFVSCRLPCWGSAMGEQAVLEGVTRPRLRDSIGWYIIGSVACAVTRGGLTSFRRERHQLGDEWNRELACSVSRFLHLVLSDEIRI